MLRQITVLLGLSAGLLAGSAAYAAEAGKLVFVTGKVTVGGAAAKQDRAVQEGDELSTGADGYAYLKTVDNGFLILRPNSKARITAYHIDPANPGNSRVKLELLSGVARSISGQGVKQARQHFRFNTPVAAIGVRGTDFIVYTDQQTSRVQVVSGGIVMSGFSGSCGVEGSGPCEGSASRELFAGQAGMLLQLSRGEHAPQLLRGAPALSPDQSAPPRSDEPVGKATAAVIPAAALPNLEVAPNLDAQKSAVLNSGRSVAQGNSDSGASAKPPGDGVIQPSLPVAVIVPDVPQIIPVTPITPVTPVTPVVVTPPVVTPPVVTPAAPELLWGRWKAVAGLPADADYNATVRNGQYGPAASIGTAYQISRVKNTALVLPTEGKASFVLSASEATLQTVGKDAVPAMVKDGYLQIDFATRQFDTGLTVYNDVNSVAVVGKGTVLKDGSMSNDLSTYTSIRGYLGGAKATEAGYIFKTLNTGKITAEGATSWRR
ncbi:FecR family protein [Duganella lactea]|uniref:FecR family protein n=1 Tax=Duganella lactea TaxID=2692173 RepID=UPI0019291D0E|nr:FecR family protein [Duganella lactea]